MALDEVHGIFTTYEMRTGKNGSSKKEAAFKLEEISTQNEPFNFKSNSMSSCVSEWNSFKFEIAYRS